MKSEGRRGLGFYLSPQWAKRLASTKAINDRVAVARLKALNADKADLAIANAYAPTTMRAKESPEITEALYRQLRQAYSQERRGATTALTLGDFNAKTGKPHSDDNVFMGKRGRGDRGENGEALRSLLVESGRRRSRDQRRRKALLSICQLYAYPES